MSYAATIAKLRTRCERQRKALKALQERQGPVFEAAMQWHDCLSKQDRTSPSPAAEHYLYALRDACAAVPPHPKRRRRIS
jgi:hypothetical protein